MPLVYSKNIPSGLIGIWEITESVNEMRNMLNLSSVDELKLNSFTHDNRKTEWLCSRILIHELIPDKGYINIIYDQFGKPHLKDLPHYISVTHSKKYVGVIIHNTSPVGIDIEYMPQFSDNRKWKLDVIAEKFVHDNESKFLHEETKHEQLLIIWGAKEAIYKMNGKPDIFFKENIMTHPFISSGNGVLNCTVTKEDSVNTYSLNFERTEEYLLVYVIGNNAPRSHSS